MLTDTQLNFCCVLFCLHNLYGIIIIEAFGIFFVSLYLPYIILHLLYLCDYSRRVTTDCSLLTMWSTYHLTPSGMVTGILIFKILI